METNSDKENNRIDLSNSDEIELYISGKSYDVDLSIRRHSENEDELFISFHDGTGKESYISLLRNNGNGTFSVYDGKHCRE